MKILLFVDDDSEMLEIMTSSFAEKGYIVYTADTALKALKILKKVKPDCITLDVMMPGMDGFTAFHEIRKVCDAPILFVTGKISEDDKVEGLLMGADDYIEKPFGFKELHARILISIKRTVTTTKNIISVPPLEINIINKTVLCNDKKIELTAREFDILNFFAQAPGEVVTYEMLGKHIFGSYMETDRPSVMVNVSRLRKKLEVDAVAAAMIETVWSIGYQFITRDVKP